MDPKSTHLPETSGAIEIVTGSLIVETNLRNLQSFVAVFAQPLVAAEEAILGWELLPQAPGTPARAKLYTYTAAGVAGTNPVKVSWIAIGK